jgi:hypothetical protein
MDMFISIWGDGVLNYQMSNGAIIGDVLALISECKYRNNQFPTPKPQRRRFLNQPYA